VKISRMSHSKIRRYS